MSRGYNNVVYTLSAKKLTKNIPVQKGDEGYKVNLRKDNWWRLGYPTD